MTQATRYIMKHLPHTWVPGTYVRVQKHIHGGINVFPLVLSRRRCLAVLSSFFCGVSCLCPFESDDPINRAALRSVLLLLSPHPAICDQHAPVMQRGEERHRPGGAGAVNSNQKVGASAPPAAKPSSTPTIVFR